MVGYVQHITPGCGRGPRAAWASADKFALSHGSSGMKALHTCACMHNSIMSVA